MIVHGCTLFNKQTNCTQKTNNQYLQQSKCSNKRANTVSFNALKEMRYLNRFDPEKSATAYELIKAFKLSYGIRDLIKNFDVTAFFSTEWLKKHPNFPYKYTGDFFASKTTMLLKIDAIPPKNKSRYKAPPAKYFGIGMYGDNSLTGSEENIAHYLRKVTFMDIKCNLQDDPKIMIIKPLPKKFYDI